MDLFFKSATNHRFYKLMPTDDLVYLYYVQVSATEHSFVHARGRDHVATMDKAQELMAAMEAVPVREQDYINALKDYFAIDKKIRLQFIKSYNL